jgi:hypothetical protein
MDLGGPVWHASVSTGGLRIEELLRAEAVRQLQGVGDASLGEWHEWTGVAYHIRRRLSVREQRAVGPVVDVRKTPEAAVRAARLGALLRLAPPGVLADEVG